MSKAVKKMEMDALRKTFTGVKNLVVISSTKVTAVADNQIRLALRKKGIRMQMVKNSLARRVFAEFGMQPEGIWSGTTVFAWGPESVKDLAKEIDSLFNDLAKKDPKFYEKVTIKTAIAEGQVIPFAKAKVMPTRTEVIGQIVSMILGPASEIAAQLTGPASQLAGQIQQFAEKKEGPPAAA
jgi:large subunit ribosomal protein L10